MRFPPYGPPVERLVSMSGDPVRYRTIALALESLEREGVKGAIAEVGVYKGDTSRFLRLAAPGRRLYLFDTFQGFPQQDLKGRDERFRDTSVDFVRRRIGDDTNVVFRQGYFPETTQGLEDEQFAFVLLDLDLFAPMLAGLEFFYPRLSPGAFLMLHDYTNPESEHAVSRAASQFLVGRPERLIAIPDRWGTALLRKV
jgi:O-methyltransferase